MGVRPKTVFLSYSNADRNLARAVEHALMECGFDVWSNESLQPGESLAAGLSSALQQADAFVVLLTERASESQWTLLEVGAALASRKPVIPCCSRRARESPPFSATGSISTSLTAFADPSD
jgi:hypothetical protein